MSTIFKKTSNFTATILCTTAFVLLALATLPVDARNQKSRVQAPAAVNDACTPPGVTILTDASGDASTLQAGHDVLSASVAEPTSIGSGKIMFVLKMAGLSTLPPDTNWPVQFKVGATDYVARMTTVPPASPTAPAFQYYTGVWNSLLLPMQINAADPASNYNADGTIQIVVPRSGIGNPGVGSNLTNFLVRISVFIGGGFATPDNMPDSLTPTGTYTVVGSENCTGGTPTPTPTPSPTATPSGTPDCTLNPSGPNCIWDGQSAGGTNESEDTCMEDVNCETFRLRLSGNPSDWVGKKAKIDITWVHVENDYDVYIHKGSPDGPIVASSVNTHLSTNYENLELDPAVPAIGTGDFYVHVVYFIVAPQTGIPEDSVADDQYHAVASPVNKPVPTPTPTATPTPPDAPRFFNYYAPPGWLEDAGEPTMGMNWKTENVSRPGPGDQTFTTTLRDGTQTVIPNGGTSLYYGGINNYFLRANFDDCASPALVNWAQIPLTHGNAGRVFYDPILFTDHWTGRTFVCQELGLTPGGSTIEFTDDDGDSMHPSQGAAPSGGVDHQTIGGGPFHAPVPPTLITPKDPPDPGATPYPHAVYYASQAVATATSELSLDGGFSYPVQTSMFTISDCAGLHGHIKVAEDGTAFVPDKACAEAGVPFVFGGHPAVVVSENNGATWDVRIVEGADSDAGVDDASVGVSWCPPEACSEAEKASRSNHIYLGFMYSGGRPGIAYSNNKGQSWVRVTDLGAQTGIKHIAFPAVAVGDPGRAAFTFFGTTTEGAYNTPEFPGIWHLYIAMTFDFGQTWTVKNVSPEGPIQRGGICGDGTCRNLLDFMDIQIDKQGRILVAGEDGCIGGCELGGTNSFTAKAFITRQMGGKRMFSIYDASNAEPRRPEAPRISGGTDIGDTKVTLTWPAPDHGGSPILYYNIYRSNIENPDWNTLTPIASVTETNYMDLSFPEGEDKYYIVTAVNDIGEGPYCKPFHPELIVLPDPCTLPGILVTSDIIGAGVDDDAPGANTPPDPRVNIRQLFAAEPWTGPGSDKVVFTLFVEPFALDLGPPNSQWFIIWNRHGTDPAPVTGPADSSFDRMYVAMATDGAGTPRFDYGKFGVGLALPPDIPDPYANTPIPFGQADSGSYDPLTGKIEITISKQKLRDIDGGSAAYQANSDMTGVNVRTNFNRLDYQSTSMQANGQRGGNNASDVTSEGSYMLRGNAFCVPQVQLVKAVSRKTHGTAGDFDVRLFPMLPEIPLGIEPRSGGGANSDEHKVVFVFATPVSFTGATMNGASVTTTPAAGSAPASEVTIHLTGVPNAQTVTVALQGATNGGVPGVVSVQMGALLGDTTHDRFVNAADITETKGQSGAQVAKDNFRTDTNVDGFINSADISQVKSKSGTGLP